MQTPSTSLIVAIPAPRREHDAVVLSAIAPVVRLLASASALEAAYFERFNKPDWGVRLRVLGNSDWLEEARGVVVRDLESRGLRFEIVNDDAEDKWIGGRSEQAWFKRIHHADTTACLDILERENRGSLGTSRAQWSLEVVERLLDLFGLRGEERLDFYRRGFQWAPDAGRWDAEVFGALEQKFESQHAGLVEVLRPNGVGQDRTAATLIDALHAPIAALLAAAAEGAIRKSPVELAVIAGHAHSNRLGIHATQEATIRYLVWRASGGRASDLSS